MKPERIEMQAFGPFMEKCEVDFSKLEDSKIFLITGPTGSGKTTILDAMSCALYAKATGSNRSWEEMRNTSAAETTPTVVTFEFSIGSLQYRFVRTLTPHIKKNQTSDEYRGKLECFTRENGEWVLENVFSKLSAKRAEELLGFTHDQFSQVIVLPQGEFKKLLVASSKEKEEMLEVIFNSTKWKQISMSAMMISAALRKQLDNLMLERKTLLENEKVETNEAFEQFFETVKKEYKAQSEKNKLVHAQWNLMSATYNSALALDEKFKRFEQLRKELTEQNERETEIVSLKEKVIVGQKIEKIYPYVRIQHTASLLHKQKLNDLIKAQEREQNARLLLSNAGKEAITLPYKESEITLSVKQIDLLSARLIAVSRLMETKNEVEKIEAQIGQYREKEQAIKAKRQELEGKIKRCQAYIAEKNENHIQKIPELSFRLNKIGDTIRAYESVKAKKELLNKTQKEFEIVSQKAGYAIQKAQSESDVLLKMEAALRIDSAYFFAMHLEMGCPCPVCGSTEHPAPAAAASETVDSAVYQAARQAAKEADEAAQTQSSMVSQLLARLEMQKNSVKEAESIFSASEFSGENLEALQKQAKESLDLANRFKGEQDGWIARSESWSAQLEQIQKELEEVQTTNTMLQIDLSAVKSKQNEIAITLDDDAVSDGQLKAKITQEQEKLDQMKADIEGIQKRREAASLEAKLAAEALTLALKGVGDSETQVNESESAVVRLCQKFGIPSGTDIMNSRMDEKTLVRMESEIVTFETKIQNIKAGIDQLKQEILDKEVPDTAHIKEKLDGITAEKTEGDILIGGLNVKLKSLESLSLKMAGIEAKRQTVEAEFRRAERMTQLLGGRTASKIPIHQFVLGIMLDEIVASANIYFDRLSRGRYNLIRVDAQGGGGFKGLDLFVMDAYEGGMRTVKTLSGGEMFLASLSLACGLSDVVQGYAGGIHLDSIFIDEGFGTLSTEVLEVAMRALADIQATGRLVGVISHVTELRERISTRIEITVNVDGSSSLSITA